MYYDNVRRQLMRMSLNKGSSYGDSIRTRHTRNIRSCRIAVLSAGQMLRPTNPSRIQLFHLEIRERRERIFYAGALRADGNVDCGSDSVTMAISYLFEPPIPDSKQLSRLVVR